MKYLFWRGALHDDVSATYNMDSPREQGVIDKMATVLCIGGGRGGLPIWSPPGGSRGWR